MHPKLDIEELLLNGITCLAHKCYNSRISKPELVYYKLPEDEKLCQTWLRNAGRIDLLQMPLDVIQRNYHLCEQHFEKKWFRKPEWKASLDYYKNPIPTIFINNIKNFPPETVQEAFEAKMKREEFMRTFPEYKESNSTDEELDEGEMYSDFIAEPSNEVEIQNDNGTFNDVKTETDQKYSKLEDSMKYEPELLEEDYMYEVENKPNPCRFCTLPVGRDDKDIFSEDVESKKVQEMVNVVLPAQVHEKDGLPHHICLVCVDKLKQCYETIIAFFAAEAFFRSQVFTEDVTSNGNGDFSDFDDEDVQAFEDPLLSNSCNLTNCQSVSEENGENIFNEQNNTKIGDVALKCGLCFMNFLSLRDLTLHRKTKHPPSSFLKKRYYCLKCPMIFMKAKTLQSHIKSTHPPEEKDYPCDDCDMVFKFKKLLNSHRKLMHKKHVCDICHKSFYYPVLLKRHMLLHDESPKCSVCNKEFKNAYWRRIHEKSHSTEGRHLCWICGKVFHLRTSLQSHVQSHSKTYKCEICNKYIATLSGFRKHQALHKERVKNYKCTTCNKAFFSNQLLKQHFLSHTGVRPHVCHCGAAFNRLSNLNYHKKRHLEGFPKKSKRTPVTDSDTQVYKCDLCNKEVVSKLTFKYHLSRHTGNKKPFDCEVCGLTFSTAYSYKTHNRIHTGERPFVCAVENCGLGFRSKSTLQQHELVHVEDRPYACPICPDSFKRLYSLNMHKTTHSGLRPYQCNICERAFARKPDARIHLMRQHAVPRNEVYEYLQKVACDEDNDGVDFPYVVEEELSESPIIYEKTEMESNNPDCAQSMEQSAIMYNVIIS